MTPEIQSKKTRALCELAPVVPVLVVADAAGQVAGRGAGRGRTCRCLVTLRTCGAGRDPRHGQGRRP